jgi:hypothetical protein
VARGIFLRARVRASSYRSNVCFVEAKQLKVNERVWPISAVPNYIGSSTWSLQIFLRTSTEFLPSTILTTPSDSFYEPFRLTLRLSSIVGA